MNTQVKEQRPVIFKMQQVDHSLLIQTLNGFQKYLSVDGHSVTFCKATVFENVKSYPNLFQASLRNVQITFLAVFDTCTLQQQGQNVVTAGAVLTLHNELTIALTLRHSDSFVFLGIRFFTGFL
eukprot:EC097258.1.p1 GENE.EC097258.1~~EC097258.1.p1  ORF type:complete len:124 (-),score=6.70 EC097258.1:16-387(-)